MSMVRLDPALIAVVERSRAQAAAAGELTAPRCGPLRSPLSLDEQRVVREWLNEGGYERGLATIVAEEPGMANQRSLDGPTVVVRPVPSPASALGASACTRANASLLAGVAPRGVALDAFPRVEHQGTTRTTWTELRDRRLERMTVHERTDYDGGYRAALLLRPSAKDRDGATRCR